MSVIWLKMKNWEFWPFWLTNIPIVAFWLFQAARTRKLFFFSTVNPGARTGGMLGNSKMEILKVIPTEYLPNTEKFKPSPNRKQEILDFLKKHSLSFPIVLKPDIGERGLNVSRIDHEIELDNYLNQAAFDVILQEYIDYPMEVTILCYQIPDSTEVGITSVCMKEFLSITGDGKQSIHSLIQLDERARLYEEVLFKKWHSKWDRIPKAHEKVWLQPIGNHCKGTKFLNANDQIDQQLIETFTGILYRMEGFNFGRFDLKCESWNLLKQGKAFKILEFNGVNSEPAHVYDPNYGLLDRYRDYYQNWALMARIHKAQVNRGIKPLELKEGLKEGKQYFRYLKAVKST